MTSKMTLESIVSGLEAQIAYDREREAFTLSRRRSTASSDPATRRSWRS